MGLYGDIALLLLLLFAIWVGRDAHSRGMSGILWGIGTYALFIIVVPIYFLIRKPRVSR